MLDIYDQTYDGPRWTYGFRNRPPGIACQPKGFILLSNREHADFRHGTLDYPRELTAKELYDFELTPVQKTIDPRAVVAIFRRTGVQPVRGTFIRDVSRASLTGPFRCSGCLLTALLADKLGFEEAERIMTSVGDGATSLMDRVAKALGLSADYCAGLITGWDGHRAFLGRTDSAANRLGAAHGFRAYRAVLATFSGPRLITA